MVNKFIYIYRYKINFNNKQDEDEDDVPLQKLSRHLQASSRRQKLPPSLSPQPIQVRKSASLSSRSKDESTRGPDSKTEEESDKNDAKPKGKLNKDLNIIYY